MRRENYLTMKNREEKTSAWMELLARSVPPRPHWRMDPARAALLVLDVQQVFCEPTGMHYLPAFEAVQAGLLPLMRAWHALHRPVILTRHVHGVDEPEGCMLRFYGSVIRDGDPGAEYASFLDGFDGEGVVRLDKHTYDAFRGTSMESLLRTQGCDQVLVAGVLTHLCVETTVRSAFVRDIEPFVLVDGCASSRESLHVNSLVSLASGFAGMLCCRQVCDVL